jgi:DNA-binding transcriptional MerR regulator
VEYRIEELARAAGVAVDTIRFYQGKGLLDAPRRDGRITWYGPDHLDRLQRIRSLQQRGFSLTVIRRFLEGELTAADEALVEAVTSPQEPELLTLEELAARSRIAVPLLQNLVQAGLLVPVQDGPEPVYPAEDLQALKAGLALVEAGIPLTALVQLGSEHAAAIEHTAEGAVELFDEHVRRRIQSEEPDPAEAERRLLEVFNDLLDESATLVRHHFQRTLLRHARARIERSRG